MFPRPEDLAGAELAVLGIDNERANTIGALARALCDKELTFESSRTLQDTISRLRAIEGIGIDTAHYIAMRAFGEPDAFPYKSLKHAPWSFAEGSRAEEWRPWRAYAAMHLWFATEGGQV